MIERMLKWLRRMLTSLFGEDRGSDSADIIISGKMESAIARWAAEYEGKPPWAGKQIKSIGLPAGITAEAARMVTMEAKLAVAGSERAEYLNTQLDPFRGALENNVELAAALGGIIFKPYVCENRIVIDAIQGDCFYPTSFDTSNRMTGAIFVDQIVRRNTVYTRLERHEYAAGTHVVQNKAFSSSNTMDLGKEISLESVPEWEQIAPEVLFPGVDRPLFGYLKMPFANRIDRHSPLGVSIFAGAENLIQNADEQYGRYLWEFEGGELAIDAAADYLQTGQDGKQVLPKGKQRLFRAHNSKDANFYNVFAPALRDESIKRGFNAILQRIEFACGLAYGTLSDPQTVDKTAEEIRASKQRSYSTIKSIQRSVETAIDDLVYAMDQLASAYHLAPSGEVEVTCNWDDSIINDPAACKQLFWQYVQAGKFPMWRYLVKFEGYSEDDARAIAGEAGGGLEDPFGFGAFETKGVSQSSVKEAAQKEAGKSLNGAQTQSLLAVMEQYAAGSLTLGQAVNIIATAIGVSKEEAKAIIEGAA